MYMIFWCKNNFYWPFYRADPDHVPGNLKRFLNREVNGDCTCATYPIISFTRSFIHRLFSVSLLVSLNTCQASLVLCLPFVYWNEERGKKATDSLDGGEFRILWKLYRGRGSSRANLADFVLFHLALRTTPLAVFHCVRPRPVRVVCHSPSDLPISALGPAGMTRLFCRENRPIGRCSTVCQ